MPAFSCAAGQGGTHNIQGLADLVLQGKWRVDDEHATGDQSALVTRTPANRQGGIEPGLLCLIGQGAQAAGQLVRGGEADDAARAIHTAFGLDSDIEAVVYAGTGR